MKLKFLLLVVSTIFFQSINAQVVISEIMYNNPGTDDLEFIELYNTGLDDVDMTGYALATAVSHTFGAVTISGQGYLIITKDSTQFQAVFSMSSIQWNSGTLNNSGENIQLLDASSQVIDEVAYSDHGDWSSLADGYGASLVLCDTKADNADPSFWHPANTNSNAIFGNRTIFANPGAANSCSMDAVVAFSHVSESILEDGVQATAQLLVNNPGPAKDLTIAIASNSTATIGDDFQFSSTTISLPANAIDTIIDVNIDIIDDSSEEQKETVVLELTSATDITFLNEIFTLDIIDNDGTLASNLILTGVFDAQLSSGAGPKGIEIFVKDDIVDLSKYAVGSAVNGKGSAGEEFKFPVGSATMGQFIFIAADSALFRNYFGFDADYISGVANINGDDAFEIFESGQVIDTYGDVNTDGTGEAWEYLDGWAYRKNGTGPDGATFVENNWVISGINQLDGADLNVDAPKPFPIKTYNVTASASFVANDDVVVVDYNTAMTIDVLSNDERPDLLSDVLTISVQPQHGTVSINADSTITYTPEQDFCGDDIFTYKGCEIGGCDEAQVKLMVKCPIAYPNLTIATVTQNDNDGISTFIDSTCALTGTVYGVNMVGKGVSFTIIDNDGDGINVYSPSETISYAVNEGDVVTVNGKIGQYKGLTEILADEIIVNAMNGDIIQPVPVTALDESTESQLVILSNLTFVDASQWTGSGSGFNVEMTDGTNTFTIRIDDKVDLFNMDIPLGTSFTVAGIGGQYDGSKPYDSGYQLLPRYATDITWIDGVEAPSFARDIRLYPNPVSDYLSISTKKAMDKIEIVNVSGQSILKIKNPDLINTINTTDLSNGIYFVHFIYNGQSWSKMFVK